MSGFIRKASVDMTAEDWIRFFQGWDALNERGLIDEYCRIHSRFAQHTMGRRNLLFLPWHSALIADFERNLNAVVPGVAFPYWDCIKEPNGPEGGMRAPPPVRTANGRTRRVNRPSRFGREDDPPTSGMIRAILNAGTYASCSGNCEDGYHNNVHNYIGGDMATVSNAPGDPLFWMHHCFCDYLWYRWRLGGGPVTGMPSMNTRMSPWGVTVGQILTSRDWQYQHPVTKGDRNVALLKEPEDLPVPQEDSVTSKGEASSRPPVSCPRVTGGCSIKKGDNCCP